MTWFKARERAISGQTSYFSRFMAIVISRTYPMRPFTLFLLFSKIKLALKGGRLHSVQTAKADATEAVKLNREARLPEKFPSVEGRLEPAWSHKEITSRGDKWNDSMFPNASPENKLWNHTCNVSLHVVLEGDPANFVEFAENGIHALRENCHSNKWITRKHKKHKHLAVTDVLFGLSLSEHSRRRQIWPPLTTHNEHHLDCPPRSCIKS